MYLDQQEFSFIVLCPLVVLFELADVELSLPVLPESHSVFQLSCLLYAAPLDEFVISLLYHQVVELYNIVAEILQVYQEDHAL